MLSYYAAILTGLVEALFSFHFEGRRPDEPLRLCLGRSGNEAETEDGAEGDAESDVDRGYALLHDIFIKNGTAGMVATALEHGLLVLEGEEALITRFRRDLNYFSGYSRFRALRTQVVQEFLEAELQRISCPYVILKGLAMKALGYYPEAWLRLSSDIDLLVEKKRVYEVGNAMLRAGFVLNENRMLNFVDYSWQRNAEAFVFTKDQVSVEVHHSPHNNAYLKWEDAHIWGQLPLPGGTQDPAVLYAMENGRYAFVPELLLLHLLTHYFKHILGVYRSEESPGHKFIWVIDVYAILRHEERPLDWKRLKALAKGPFNCYELCLFVLGLACSFFPSVRTRIPADIRRDIAALQEQDAAAFGLTEADYLHLVCPDAADNEAMMRKMEAYPLRQFSPMQKRLYKLTNLLPPPRALQIQYPYAGKMRLPLLYAKNAKHFMLQRLRKKEAGDG